jgi:chromosome segregation ATPase
MENFEERFVEFENRLLHTAESKTDEINRSTEEIEQKLLKFENQIGSCIDSQMQTINDEYSIVEKRLLDIKSEVINYEEHSKIFTRTDALAGDLAGSIDRLNRMLEDSRKEAQNLEKFFADIDYIKELAKEFDREIRAYQNKKEKLADIESEIKSLQEMSDFALEKANSCQEQFSKIDAVSSRIDALVESYGSLELRIRELHEYEDVITKNLDSVNKADILMQSMEGKINTFQKVVDRADKRVDKINQHLHDVEENTLILKTRESDIKEVKDKFSELEGLSEHMESRIKQIYAMFQKVETLRDEISITDTRLQELFTETDKKMKQFADFIQAVDDNNPILKQVKGNTPAAKNFNENVIRTVRDLSNRGWTSDEISKKLMMDENAVRFIINTSSL